MPESGWISFYIRDVSDASDAIALFRLNYDRPWLAERDRATPPTSTGLPTLLARRYPRTER